MDAIGKFFNQKSRDGGTKLSLMDNRDGYLGLFLYINGVIQYEGINT